MKNKKIKDRLTLATFVVLAFGIVILAIVLIVSVVKKPEDDPAASATNVADITEAPTHDKTADPTSEPTKEPSR